MREGRLISFSGMDGTGKTTLANYIVEELRERGVDARYSYCRYVPFFIRPLIYLSKFVFYPTKSPKKNYTEYNAYKRSAIKQHPILSTTYKTLSLWEYYFQLFFKIYIPLTLLKKVIICDRYIIDTAINDFAIDFKLSDTEIRQLVMELYSHFPRPEIQFVVDAPEEIVLNRKDDIPTLEYLKERRRLYLMLGQEVGAIVVDGTLSLDEIKRKLIQKVG